MVDQISLLATCATCAIKPNQIAKEVGKAFSSQTVATDGREKLSLLSVTFSCSMSEAMLPKER